VGQRVLCPRCGESFTVLATQTASAGIQAEPPAPALSTTITTSPPVPGTIPGTAGTRKPRNWIIAALVLGVMGLMATVGLTFALYTQAERRANDLGLKQRPRRHLLPFDRPDTEPAAPTRPAELAGLGYVPPGSNVLLGLQVAELLRDQAGRQLLNRPLEIGRQEVQPGQLANWCGLARDDVDHLVLALATDGPILPRVNLIVRTRRPYLADRVRSALKAEKVPDSAKKDLYRFSLPNGSLQPVIWFIDDRTLALGLLPSHLDTIPAQPRQGLEHLPPDLRELLRERVEPAPVWCAGVVEERARGLLATLLPRLPKEELERWTALRAFTAWVQVREQVQVGAALHCRDEQAAEQLVQAMSGPGPRAGSPWKAFRDSTWVTLQWKGELETFLNGLSGGR